MGELSSQKITLGVFDHLDDAGVDISRQYQERSSLVETYDQLGFHAYHIAEHHCTIRSDHPWSKHMTNWASMPTILRSITAHLCVPKPHPS
jgi:alkanesulfonate monooxygenase SsuD/methylene tetrahydromethanopterin reductase-like flavin-dependent oxidoreductase (luciferase family)